MESLEDSGWRQGQSRGEGGDAKGGRGDGGGQLGAQKGSRIPAGFQSDATPGQLI